jgi:hypothetical protein
MLRTKNCRIKIPFLFVVNDLKGQCHEIFRFWFFSSISFPPAIEYPIRTVSNFFKNSRRYSQLKVDHRCRWHQWQMKKIFHQKNFNNFVGTPLGSRVNTYIQYIFAFKFTLRYLQPDINPIVCHRCRWYRLPPVSTTLVKLVAKFSAGGKFATDVVDTGGQPWAANISANFRKNSKRP